jgi:hypothetical protein
LTKISLATFSFAREPSQEDLGRFIFYILVLSVTNLLSKFLLLPLDFPTKYQQKHTQTKTAFNIIISVPG